MKIAYLDPPYSRYFQRLAARLTRLDGGDVVALLSSPAYRHYTRGDRSVVWPPGAVAIPPPLPPDSAHATWSQEIDLRFRAVFWHCVAWLRQCFREQGTDLCLIFSDARPFSLAAAVAANEEGVRCLYFERGAHRFCTASLSSQGLNARFSLQRARALVEIKGLTEDAVLERRPEEPWLRWNFARFIVANEAACWAASARRLLQHKHYAFAPYARLAVTQWWVDHFRRRRTGSRPHLQVGDPIVVVPLQVPADSQLRLYSPFADNQAFLDFVVQQAQRVSPGVHVFVKRHPMDGTRYRMPEGARAVSGNLSRFFKWQPVVVCINSTVGFEAAVRGVPVLCFGDSFYTTARPVQRVKPSDFAERLAERLGQATDRAQGHALHADVLRWYQAPGDAWAYSEDDLDRSAEIVLQHLRAVPTVLRVVSSAAQAAADGDRGIQPVAQRRKA